MADDDTILIVDDDADVAMVLADYLQQEGRQVTAVHCGAAAIERVRRQPVSLVLLDLSLPDVDGISLMHQVQALDRASDVIVVTGHATLASAITALEAGAAGYVEKPVDLAHLGILVNRCFERRRLVHENARLVDELTRRQRESTALHTISSTLMSTLDFREALCRVSCEFVGLLGADAAMVYLRDPGTDSLVPVIADDVSDERLAALAAGALPLRDRPLDVAGSANRAPVESDDVAHDLRFDHDAVRRVRHQSAVVIPLVVDGAVAATFYLVWWEARRRLSTDEIRVVDHVASQVALFLKNARLYEQAQRDRRRLEVLNRGARRLGELHDIDRILSLIVHEAVELLGVEAAGLRLVEGDELVLRARTESAAAVMSRPTLKIGESISGAVMSTGEPVATEDLGESTQLDAAHRRGAIASGFRGSLVVPLKAHGAPIGTLSIYSRQRRRFVADEVALLTAFADQAALAVEKGQLLDETQAREREAAGLYKMTSRLASSLESDRLFDLITQTTVETLGGDASGLFVYDERCGGLVLLRGFQLDPELTRDLVLRPGDGVAGRAFQDRRPAWTRDLLHDASLRYTPTAGDLVHARAPRAHIAVPIMSGEHVHGVLVHYHLEPHDFTPKEVQLLSTLASHAAIAIDKSRLFEETRTQRRQLGEIFDSTSDGIVLVTPAGQIIAANRRAGELLDFDHIANGVSLLQVLEGHFTSADDLSRATRALAAVLDDPSSGGEDDLDLSDTGRVVHWVARPSRDASGVSAITLTFQDVTQEREVSRMKSDFVSFVTHQLRTPLSGIKWLLEIAASSPDLAGEPASYVADARGAAERLIRLVNDLLDVSRLESGNLALVPEETDLDDVTRNVLDEVRMLVDEKQHRVSVGRDAPPPTVMVDPQLMRQVVLNLVSNAIKYTPAGGEISIRIAREGDELHWAIHDNGIGIPKDAYHRLFEKFYRAENALTIETEGTGLGLYLIKLIVERFGGRVWCESEEANGATFTFALPRYDAILAASRADAGGVHEDPDRG